MKSNVLYAAVTILLMLSAGELLSQVAINADGSAPDSSAMLDVKSVNRGLLPPRMTQAQRDAIVSPAAGLIIWCSNCGLYGELQVYNGITWTNMTGNAASLPLTLPVLTTTAISNIQNTTATGGGNITSDGGTPVIMRGICWNTTSNPTTADSHTIDGSGIGAFESNLTNLSQATTYYVRAYATNGVGTALGNEVSFSTLSVCGTNITINHLQGVVAPVTKTVTYGTVTNIPGQSSKCWITSNLGANHQANAVNDATEASAGWYWQFNRQQGFMHDGTMRLPNTSWITAINENLDWQPANDPCSIELGSGWRIPTSYEWITVTIGWSSWNEPWSSGLKMHASGRIFYNDGTLFLRGSVGSFWSNTKATEYYGNYLHFNGGYCGVPNDLKAYGLTLRCIKD